MSEPIKLSLWHEASDGTVYKTLAEAQAHQLHLLLLNIMNEAQAASPCLGDICKALVARPDQVIAILQTKPGTTPRRKTRKDAGKKRAKKEQTL